MPTYTEYEYKIPNRLVYAIKAVPLDLPAIKFGLSARDTFIKRLCALQDASPYILETLVTIPVGISSTLEAILEDRFFQYKIRSRGEWYNYTPEIQKWIEEQKRRQEKAL